LGAPAAAHPPRRAAGMTTLAIVLALGLLAYLLVALLAPERFQ
jgi:K+-transporting ATPase KdpF subunit